MGEYKKWLQDDLLKRSNGNFAIGEETFRKKLAADEMIELPLDELLAIAERDLRRQPDGVCGNRPPTRSEAHAGQSAQGSSRPIIRQPEKLLSTTQAELDALGRFMTEKRIVTIPKAAPARVEETPAVSASDHVGVDGHPGAFRDRCDRGVLQHDPAGSRRRPLRRRTSS